MPWPAPLAALGAATWSDIWPHTAPELFSSWDVSLLLLTFTQQLKNKKETETEMLYGSAPRTPNKRRGLAPTKPGKVLKVNRVLCGPHSRRGGVRPGLWSSLPSVLQRRAFSNFQVESLWEVGGPLFPFSLCSHFPTYKTVKTTCYITPRAPLRIFSVFFHSIKLSSHTHLSLATYSVLLTYCHLFVPYGLIF